MTKVVLGFGSIWGLFAFGALLLGSFTFGANDSTPEVVALSLYGLTLLPCCIIAIWFRKPVALWLVALTSITAFGFVYQFIRQMDVAKLTLARLADLFSELIVASIPGLIGTYLLRNGHREGNG